MKNSLLFAIPLLVLSCNGPAPAEFAIVIHGGAGNITASAIPPERAAEIEKKMAEALDLGTGILENGGSSLDAVEMVVALLEDSPHFNAGKGAVFTHAGTNELDACIMDGATLNAGAVAAVGDIRNPIRAARVVMEESPHVLLTGSGASEFALEMGLEIVDSTYFFTERRWKSLQEQLAKKEIEKYGTVGCVALDNSGNLAAATSTGGMTNKLYGRIGDSPIAGAGNYANNATCAVSGTGHGEYFMRLMVGHDISAMMEYGGYSVEEASRKVVQEKLKNAGGTGGVICVDRSGNITMEYNSKGMLRACADATGRREIHIFD